MTPPASPPQVLIELELGDAEFVMRRHGDGMVTLDLNDARVLLTPANVATLAEAFAALRLEP